MWIIISCALSAVGSVLLSYLVARRVVAGAASSVRSARSLHSRTESLEAWREEATTTLADLANRMKMQRVRHAGLTHAAGSRDEPPDPYKDPDGWRTWANRRRLANGKSMLGGE